MGDNKRIAIPFHFDMYDFENRNHIVEKADKGGTKHRYIKGISSGMKTDEHGERMTQNCIRKMQEQANSGSILLYEGQHGVTHTEDLGILVESDILQNGDWMTTYRLYDESDGFEPGSATIERANKLWKQMNGFPPYVDKLGKPKPLQKGFSIEGYIPDSGIIEMGNDGKRVIDEVELDGVLVTPRPAYKPSVATAIYKALDELRPEKKMQVAEGIRNTFDKVLQDEKRKESYYNKRYKLEDALNDSIERIMSKGFQIRERLKLLFDEYAQTMIRLLEEHAEVFETEPGFKITENGGSVDVAKEMQQRVHVLKNIQAQLSGFVSAKSATKRKA